MTGYRRIAELHDAPASGAMVDHGGVAVVIARDDLALGELGDAPIPGHLRREEELLRVLEERVGLRVLVIELEDEVTFRPAPEGSGIVTSSPTSTFW